MRIDACIFVVSEIENASLKVNVAARLVGGTIATPEFLESSGCKGSAISFLPAIAIARAVFITEEFLQSRPLLAEDIVKASQLVESKWSFRGTVFDSGAYFGPAPRRAKQKKERALIVFALEAEKGSEDAPCMKNWGHLARSHKSDTPPQMQSLAI